MLSDQLVVVTGCSGLIAKHTTAELLKRGFTVRGTLRSPAKADDVRKAVSHLGADPARLSFVTADLLSDASWDSAVDGAAAVLHTASPFPIEQPENADDVIVPARDGTLRVLKAATNARVPRIVMTSSTVAIFYPADRPRGHVYSEADFTDEARTDITPYIKSKTIAEKAAWDFVANTAGAPQLVAINPGFVQGPIADGDLSTSHELFRVMARGVYPAAPKIRFPVADVRDVVDAHVEAMVRPQAAGKRYLIGEGLLGIYELGQIMAKELPDLKAKVPRFELPDAAVRALALVDKRMRTILPELGQHKDYTNLRARTDLGLSLRPAEEAARASVASLREFQLI